MAKHQKTLQRSSITARLVCALVASVVSIGLQGQTPAARPTLVVGIMVEGLNEDYIDLLRHRFSDGGFRYLIDHGVVLEDVSYGSGIDRTAAAAMLMTGTTPSVNGITAGTVYNQENKRALPILNDPAVLGNYTTETYSPKALLVSTLSDEVRINDTGVGQVYSLAPEPQTAIILAGHAGNSAFWIDDVTGKWATTTFYKDVPSPAKARNYPEPLENRLDKLKWEPLLPLDQYPDQPDHKQLYPFSNRFSYKDKDRFREFKASAMVNQEITDIASDYISQLKLGGRGVMDMLNISYTVAPYPYSRDSENRIETQDAYIRLDRDIERLIKAVEQGPGLDHTLIFLAGSPAPYSGKRDDDRWNIPHGEFSPRKAMSLLNMYLIAIHGNGEWVNGYHNGQFFLNQKLIKDKDLDLHTLRSESADFLSRMAGVARVYTIEDIVNRRVDQADESLRKNILLSNSGDLFVTINPGWEVVDDESGSSNGQVQRLGAQTFPVFILAPDVKAQRISTPLDVTVLAPTVARLLRIRSPNAAATPPLRLR